MKPACIAQLIQVELLLLRLRLIQIQGDSLSGSTTRNFRVLGDFFLPEKRYISGSGQFSADNIKATLSKQIQNVAGKVECIVIDLRSESHLFMGGIPYTYVGLHNQANNGMTLEQIEQDEAQRIEELLQKKSVTVETHWGHKEVAIQAPCLERSVVEGMGYKYIRLPILDHSRPSDDQVDNFLSIIRNFPNCWIHFHCYVGMGRTTTFLALYDMYFNAKNVSFDGILERQKAHQGADLKEHETKHSRDPYLHGLAKNRLEFLKRFYRFCQEANLEEETWSMWIKKKENEPAALVLRENHHGSTIRNFRDMSHFFLDKKRYVSGSGQFSTDNIKSTLSKTIQKVAGKVECIVIDLRSESHLFMGGIPYTYMGMNSQSNKGMTLEQIEQDEAQRLAELLQKKTIEVETHRGHKEVAIQTPSVERSVVEAIGYKYIRLPVLDHSHPSDDQVDIFISIIKNSPQCWIHLHCYVGMGRTTTLLALYDMYFNAKNVSFDAILARQKAHQGADLKEHETKHLEDPYLQGLAEKRLEFLKKFYRNCQEAKLEEQTWSMWNSL